MGKIAGPGGPHDKGGVVIDTRDAILLDTVNVAVVGAVRGKAMEEIVIAMELGGRVNNTEERSEELYLFDADGAAAIISELIGIASRFGPEFQDYLQARLDALP